MSKELNRQLRENESKRTQIVEQANRAWQQLVVATSFQGGELSKRAERLADIDVAETRRLLEAFLKHVQSAQDLRAERNELRAELTA